MSDLLGIGYSGLKAYSRALSTIGDNIANAQTPGYARRRLEMMEAVGGGNSIFYRGNTSPGGVDIRGLDRSVDQWLIADSRLTSGDAERAAARLDWLGKVEGALSDETNGIKTGLTRLFTTADQLTADPANRTLRAQFLQSVDDIASGFRTAADQLAGMSDGISGAATSAVGAFNANLEALEQINIGLRKARPGSTNEASLLDERDRLLDKLSSQAGVSASFDNNGAVTLRAAGPGDLLVGGGVVTPIAVTAAPDGRLSYSVGGAPLAIATGSLAGLAEGANHVADQRAALDTMAADFAAQLNAAHQAGADANGNPGQPLFTGASAATLTAAPLTPDQVAAADASSGNGNMLAFGAMRGANDPEARWSGLMATQAQTVAAARAHHAAATTRADAAAAARDGVSQIDLDTEAAELLRYQQAYSAAARTIQVARETMQTLLSSL
ncbi:flagellar hook-associated protein FlgK [Sphingopyxis alaskensis]|jgi:flagellar hook-associated protein 1 FlgK|uniref:Flagellar hook-associated protein 1 n=1 Tax=Sphingopyxis alaskensis (strain DSM 13593 / LMG 18877 / RB2256) TaxID=317655 RepID=Q1GP01_SPHAL|nr:flagellar hook-associated protein FlgK [Sphingopyxis alaskensis]ABF54621.1 Flagellar hook-associated protein [Sphingopyxis alaskensis RB2256]MCM3418538.1 flagellar hook-associated protein FlgK [Sphingopyxis alaskensis]